jgi:hypothetical protein
MILTRRLSPESVSVIRFSVTYDACTPESACMDASTPAILSPGAIRARRYRARQKRGIRCTRVRMSETAIRFLVEAGFLASGSWQDADIEAAIYGLLNAASAAGVTCYDNRRPS